MNLATLSLLVDIIEAGNLSRAAARLGVSRASVSQRLNQFERELDQQLLRRTTRQIEPTELGWKLYEHGRAIRQELLAATESVGSLGQSLQGTVRLSVPSGYGQLTMSSWLTEFMQLYPGVTLEVVFDNDIEDLLEGAVDFAMRVMTEPPPNLVARNMGPMHYVACATPALVEAGGMPASLADLHQVPLISSNLTGQKLRLAGYQVGGGAELRHAAFRNPDGSLALVLRNGGKSATALAIRSGGKAWQLSVPAGEVLTLVWPDEGTAR